MKTGQKAKMASSQSIRCGPYGQQSRTDYGGDFGQN
jgi:hypothetical protein